MLKLSLARGVTGGGVCWEDGDVGDTEKRLSVPMTLITWLLGLWGRRGLICVEGQKEQRSIGVDVSFLKPMLKPQPQYLTSPPECGILQRKGPS